MKGDIADFIIIDGNACPVFDNTGAADGIIVDERAGGLQRIPKGVFTKMFVLCPNQQIFYMQGKPDEEFRFIQVDVIIRANRIYQFIDQVNTVFSNNIRQIIHGDTVII